MLNLGIEGIFEKEVDIYRNDFFDIDTSKIERYLSTLLRDEKKEIIKRADLALEGKVYAFSSQLLDYGQPIDWQLNPLTGKRTNSATKWYKNPDFDSERGDIKVIWEMSRFSHLYYFLRAYMLTKDEKYYNGFSNQISDWLSKNSYSYGAIFIIFMRRGITIFDSEENIRDIHIMGVIYNLEKSDWLARKIFARKIGAISEEEQISLITNNIQLACYKNSKQSVKILCIDTAIKENALEMLRGTLNKNGIEVSTLMASKYESFRGINCTDLVILYGTERNTTYAKLERVIDILEYLGMEVAGIVIGRNNN